MKQGDAFIIQGGLEHLIIVVSDPERDPGKIVLIGLTSDHPAKDRSCILNAADHPWIRHPTLASYRHASITDRRTLIHQMERNMIRPHPDPASPKLLKAILEGARLSHSIPSGVRQTLQGQGLIP